jgi:hypothetical protein
MARTRKPDGNLEVLEQLNAWARKYNLSQDSYVSALASALENRSNLPFWSTMSATDFLPKSVVATSRNQLIYNLTLLRNLLIFAPVAITWLAIGEASRAFAVFTESNNSNVVNFLQFWQNGYGVLAEEWTLSRVAILDASILLFIMVLIVIIANLNQRTQRQRSELEIVADDDRMRVAIAVDSYLFEKRTVTNVTLNQGLSRALQELKNTSSSLNRTAKVVEKAEKGTPTSRKILSEIKKLSDLSKER